MGNITDDVINDVFNKIEELKNKQKIKQFNNLDI